MERVAAIEGKKEVEKKPTLTHERSRIAYLLEGARNATLGGKWVENEKVCRVFDKSCKYKKTRERALPCASEIYTHPEPLPRAPGE